VAGALTATRKGRGGRLLLLACLVLTVAACGGSERREVLRELAGGRDMRVRISTGDTKRDATIRVRPVTLPQQEVDGAMTLIQACEAGRDRDPALLLPRTVVDRGQLPDVPCRGGGRPAETGGLLRDAGPRPAARPRRQPPVVKTNSPMVKKAREGVMEFLLINHPLDCPICDQGGECDLQDQAMAYGVDFSRFREPKRAVEDLDLGPLVETHMTRCISCTRCVRFTTEVAGITQMGQTGRGEDAEITSYLGETLQSNLQGNIIDLCPVGALVSNKPYAFTARPWELTKTETIDVMDALGSNIRVDTKGREVMRILPRNHDGVNEEWISDKTRFVWDGLRRQRLDRPYVRENGKLRPATWPEALAKAAAAIKGATKLAGLVGDLAPVEAAYSAQDAGRGAGRRRGMPHRRGEAARRQPLRLRRHGLHRGHRRRQAIMLIGTNPRDEAPVLNARIRKAWAAGAHVGLIGPKVDLTYDYHHFGDGRDGLAAAFDHGPGGSHDIETVVIVGQGALQEADGAAVLAEAMRYAEATQGSKLLVLHTAASRVGAMDVGAVNDDVAWPRCPRPT
jgi:NADH-quinone oxidoreductase subunit G